MEIDYMILIYYGNGKSLADEIQFQYSFCNKCGNFITF